MRSEITRHNVLAELRCRVPEFGESRPPDADDEPYMVLGDLADFLIARVPSAPSDAVLEAAFSFLDELATSSDLELQNLVVIGVFEPLADNERGRALARNRLHGRSLATFERVVRGWIET